MNDKAQIDFLFKEIQSLLPTCDAPYIRGKLADVQKELDSLDDETRPAGIGDDTSVVERAQALMARNIQAPLTIAQIAEACNTSPSKLKRAFRATLDSTVFQWYRSLRIERSKELLAETDLSIARVAAAVGYSNASKFSRAFQEHTGMTPRSWRSRALRHIPGGCG